MRGKAFERILDNECGDALGTSLRSGLGVND